MLKTEAIEQGMLNTPYMWVIYKLLVSQKSQHKMFLGHSALQGWLWFSCHELWYKILAHISEKSNLGSFHFHWKFYRVSGVHTELLKAGAFMGFHAGWEQPDWYAVKGEEAEYKPSFNRYYTE